MGAVGRLQDALDAARYDLVWVLREVFPLGPALLEEAVRRRSARLVYDLDDAVFLPNVSPVHRLLGPLRNPGRTERLVRAADWVLAGSPALVEWCRSRARRVELVPTVVDTEAIRPGTAPEGASGPGPLRIGWTGSHTTLPYLRDWIGAMAAWAAASGPLPAALEGARLELRGARGRADAAGSPPRIPGLDALGWSAAARPWSEAEEAAWLSTLDLGVAPLPDIEWTRYKCGLRILRYAAAGVPAAASPVGVQADFAAECEGVSAARAPQEWAERLDRLARDRGEARRLGREARRWVEARYSVAAWSARLADLLRRAAFEPVD
jgi:glycosyltransferase involved in cell wall biosynthesis